MVYLAAFQDFRRPLTAMGIAASVYRDVEVN